MPNTTSPGIAPFESGGVIVSLFAASDIVILVAGNELL